MLQKEKAKKTAAIGFTLIELLVVISIISMLLSITLPSLNKAKEASKRVVCLSNLRQLTLTWYLYATDNDDKLCSPMTRNNYPGNWVKDSLASGTGGTEIAIRDGALWPYAETIKLYECKSARGYRSVHARPERLRDYSMSRSMGLPKGGRMGIGSFRSFQTHTEISGPSGKMVFIDADGGTQGANTLFSPHWLLDSFWPLALDSTVPEWEFLRSSDGAPSNIITARHNNGCNLSFADGHCHYWKYKDRRTVRLAIESTGRRDEADASVNNPDLDYMVRLLKAF